MNTRTLSLLVAAAALTACASAPAPRPAAAPAQPVNLTRVYFYPQGGQDEAQQDRDRYDCHVWSVRQTGFDPSRRIAPEVRAAVVPARSSVGPAAVAGAVIGAVIAGPGDVVQGAAIGALAGGVLGAAADGADAGAARAVQTRHDAHAYGRYGQEAAEFRRAMSACLEGRGYSVR